ncbi:hypothetical protein QYE76_056094 [Lolium multiflorum]|uniref:CCHC-type domain-containing protein n=1 Tax=Lolium multiflorum TaxID=4521 RepID=A0AAD8T2B8_LOLMU|nr:hypothetical protein QYE76_056094 [Lolium multiflorum]
MASSAAEPPPPPPPPPGGGEGSASTRSRSTPVAVEFVYPSGVPTLPVSRGEDWESEGSNAWIPSGIDPALAFRLVVRLDSSFTRDSKRYKNGFFFPAVVATTISLRNLKANICAQYNWSFRDAVHFEYLHNKEGRFVPLISDDDLGILFALNASCRFGKIRIHVDRGRASSLSGAGASSGGRASCLSTAAASSNSVRRGAPCRSTAAPSVPSASGSQIVRTVDVEDDADIEDQSPQDDEDELMFPELVDRCSKQAMEDQYMEDIAFGARFDDTDDEEKNENDDSLVLADYEGEDLPTIEWNREDPQLVEGTVFQTMMDCRNAITTYHILTKNNFEIKKNKEIHRCPPLGGEPELKTKLAKTRWLADIILDWLREDPSLGPTALVKKVVEKYKMKVPYMRMFYAKEMALDKINGPWNESFQLLYTFKAEVEMASPGSVVAIDKHTVPYKLKSGKVMHKECFRRAFVCFKACWKGFLDGCRPYLAVDASALHGRFKGQLVAATAVDGHNWMFPVAYGVLEVESQESWTWFLQNLRDLIGHPPGLVIHTDACKGGEDGEVDQYVSEYFSVAKFRAAYAMNVPTLLGKDQWMKVDPGFKLYSPVLTRPAGRPRKNRIRASAEGGAPIRKRKCKRCGIPGHIARLCKNGVDPAFGMEDQAGAENAEENEAAIQLEIEAAVQHEVIEAANAEEIEAAVQHEEIEAANAEEIEAAIQHEEIEPMDREQREQMDVELLQPMSPEEREQYSRECLESSKAMIEANFEEYMAEEKAQALQKKKNKKEGKRKVDTGNIPGRVTRSKVVAPASHTRSKRKILF